MAVRLDLMTMQEEMERNEYEQAVAGWQYVCESKGYVCKGDCGEYPPYEDREAFFENGGICSRCMNKFGHYADK
jgi:hypothetical protein